VTGLPGRAGIAGAALIVLAGLVVALATALPAPTVTTSTQGVDVSSHEHPRNAVINWPEVAAAGYTFTAIKASEATYYVNPYYASDAVQAARAGLFVMPYAFANPYPAKDNGSAREQADTAARELDSAAVPARQRLPLALDIEPDPYTAEQKTNECYGLSRTAMVRWIRQFMAEAQLRTGQKPVIYTLAGWWKVCTGNSAAFGGYPLWIAWYERSDPALPAGWRTYTFWQHTSSGAVPGIAGSTTDVDYLGPVSYASPVAKPWALAQLRALASDR
jgi:GH25 family lysozyme M1 (1,4-beta-N-acetylmuramidase)